MSAIKPKRESLHEHLEHPMQPLFKDQHGTIRFKPNAIIGYLFDTGKLNLNEIVCMPFEAGDHEQIAQLLGYSVCGFADLSFVRDETYEKAWIESEKLKKQK